MTREAYRRPPEDMDMVAEERAIRRATSLATVVTLAGFAAAYWMGATLATLPTAAAERLLFAALYAAVPGAVFLVAILLVSTARRGSAADIGGQAAGPPSERLAIKAAFLQNTLEQTLLAALFYLALAAVAGGAWLALIPVAALLFVIGRVLFYLGYRRGAQGRAMGMALTMMPSATGYLLVGGLAIFGD